MNRQELLNNFVTLLNGEGRSVVDGECCYFPDNDHPGCGIGCQPGFRDNFIHLKNILEGKNIRSIISNDFNSKVAKFFKVENSSDINFLHSLQSLHDQNENWLDDGKINPIKLERFCKDLELSNPLG